MILRLPETQRCRDACGSGLHGIRADPSPAQELPPAFERPEPFLERRQDSDDDVLLCPEGGRSIWRLFAKPKQARNFKDLKHLKCRYTFRIGALIKSGRNCRIRDTPTNPPVPPFFASALVFQESEQASAPKVPSDGPTFGKTRTTVHTGLSHPT